MSRPIEELRTDHELVRTGLRVLGAIGDHVRNGGYFPVDDTALALRFLREFLVATHFRKENEVVWPTIAMRGAEDVAAAVGELMRSQDEATELITSLIVFWEPASELTEDERMGFADTVDALAARLQQMQAVEEQLFLACERDVPPDDKIDWSEQFAVVESERARRRLWEPRVRRLASDWAA